MAIPAATSHSDVGPNLRYKSTSPEATKQNFNELPTVIISHSPTVSINKFVSLDLCDLLDAILFIFSVFDVDILDES